MFEVTAAEVFLVPRAYGTYVRCVLLLKYIALQVVYNNYVNVHM